MIDGMAQLPADLQRVIDQLDRADRVAEALVVNGEAPIQGARRGATYQTPFFELLRVKVATGLPVLPAHDRRHLWQAERVRNRPDFPGA